MYNDTEIIIIRSGKPQFDSEKLKDEIYESMEYIENRNHEPERPGFNEVKDKIVKAVARALKTGEAEIDKALHENLMYEQSTEYGYTVIALRRGIKEG